MLSARRYTEKIKLYGAATITDKFGAIKKDAPFLIGERWAKVIPQSSQRKMYYFDTTDIESYEIEVRYAAQMPKVIEWKGQILQVDSVIDWENRHRILNIVAVKR